MPCDLCQGELSGRVYRVKLRVLIDRQKGHPVKVETVPYEKLVCLYCFDELQRGSVRVRGPGGDPNGLLYRLVDTVEERFVS